MLSSTSSGGSSGSSGGGSSNRSGGSSRSSWGFFRGTKFAFGLADNYLTEKQKHKISNAKSQNINQLIKLVAKSAVVVEIRKTTDVISACDLLIIDGPAKFNLLYSCHIFAEKWIAFNHSGNRESILALQRFLEHNPKWFVTYHNLEKNALTILSCLPEDRYLVPIMPTQPTTLKNGPNICNQCPFKSYNRCIITGIYLNESIKNKETTWIANTCPLVKEQTSSSSSFKWKCYV